jgi:hypothetical protein
MNRSKLAGDMAYWLHRQGQGVSHADAAGMTGPQKQMVLNAVRPGSGPSKLPSADTWQLAMEKLQQLESKTGKTPAPIAPSQPKGLSGKSLSIARQLADTMKQ